MDTFPHPIAPAGADAGAWSDVAEAVAAAGSTLDPGQLLAAIREFLSGRTQVPVEVFALDREQGLLRGPTGRAAHPLPGALAAALQLETRPVPLDPDWPLPRQASGPGVALGLRDGDEVTGVALFEVASLRADAGLPVIANLFGAALARASHFDQLKRLTGDSEHTRNLQQQILDHVSHEFNTPLMILRSSADFARESSDEERELFFDMHAQALDRLEELVRGVIEVGHATARGDMEWMSTEDVATGLVLPQFVDAEWPQGVPELWHRAADVQVQAEAESLGLAIGHLVRNARDHAPGAPVAVSILAGRMGTPPRGLETALAALAGQGPQLPEEVAAPDALWIEVVDAGPGIPASELSLVFEPFTQGSNSPLRGVSGAGMGLATASRLIESAGGQVDVESTLGKGSLFRICLPAR